MMEYQFPRLENDRLKQRPLKGGGTLDLIAFARQVGQNRYQGIVRIRFSVERHGQPTGEMAHRKAGGFRSSRRKALKDAKLLGLELIARMQAK